MIEGIFALEQIKFVCELFSVLVKDGIERTYLRSTVVNAVYLLIINESGELNTTEFGDIFFSLCKKVGNADYHANFLAGCVRTPAYHRA